MMGLQVHRAEASQVGTVSGGEGVGTGKGAGLKTVLSTPTGTSSPTLSYYTFYLFYRADRNLFLCKFPSVL